jgi:nicotinamide-nucleotide amidase
MRQEVELVSTGAELLNGRTVNRHAAVLGDYLRPLGMKLVRDTTVPDDIDLIEEAVSSALKRVDIVVVSGGLGPTSDDVTREAIAQLLNRRIVMDATALDALRKRFQAMGRAVTEQQERQAKVVEGAVALLNPVGAAPGQCLELESKIIFILPGPPREFLAVLEKRVLPCLQKKMGALKPLVEKIFLVCGIGESDIVARFEKEGFPPPGIDAAYCAAPGRLEVRLTSPDNDEGAVNRAAETVRPILGDCVFAEERQEMEEVVGQLLRREKATLATAESCTGGLVGHLITSVSGSSDYYLGGLVAYANEVKIRELSVNANALDRLGAVSEEVARQMARGVRERFNSDYGLSVTGIAGPTGGAPEKPLGLVYAAVADKTRVWARRHCFSGDRSSVKTWSSQMALDLLRRRLQGLLKDEQ